MAEKSETGMLTPTLHWTTGKCNSTGHYSLSCSTGSVIGHSRQIEVGWIWPYVFGTLVSTEVNVWIPD
jgi:hypothetical protein